MIPFLRNVTRGRGIPEERLEEVRHHYRHFGGVSPINHQNRALKAALEAELARRGIELPVLWGNRNWDPYLRDVIAEAHTDGHTRLLAIATSAYSSYSGCRQYREDFAEALAVTGLEARCGSTRCASSSTTPASSPRSSPACGRASRMSRRPSPASTSSPRSRCCSPPTRSRSDAARAARPSGRIRDGGAYEAQHLAVAAPVMRPVAAPTGVCRRLAARLPVPLRAAEHALAGARHQRRHRRCCRPGASGRW